MMDTGSRSRAYKRYLTCALRIQERKTLSVAEAVKRLSKVHKRLQKTKRDLSLSEVTGFDARRRAQQAPIDPKCLANVPKPMVELRPKR